MRPSVCNATAIRKASRRLTQLYDDALAPCGLRSTQYAVLSELARSEAPPTMSELAHALVLDRSALGHNLRPLERDGLVAMTEGDADRRRRFVTLTPEGRRQFAAAALLWQRAQDRFDAVFGAEAAEALRSSLLRVAHEERLGALRD